MRRLSSSAENLSTILSISDTCTRSRYTLHNVNFSRSYCKNLCESEVHYPSKISSWKSMGHAPRCPIACDATDGNVQFQNFVWHPRTPIRLTDGRVKRWPRPSVRPSVLRGNSRYEQISCSLSLFRSTFRLDILLRRIVADRSDHLCRITFIHSFIKHIGRQQLLTMTVDMT